MKKFIIASLLMALTAGMAFAQEDKKAEPEKKTKSVKEYIADLSSDKEEQTIIEAARYLGKEKEEDAVPNLVSLLADRRMMVRMEAVSSLGLIGEESSVEALNKALLEDESAEVRYAAVLATFRIGSKKSVDSWKQSLQNETDPYIKDFLTKAEKKFKGN